jgi:hypothetical protein
MRFRPPNSNLVAGAVTDLLAVGQLIDDAMQPGNFFVAPEMRVTWTAARSETIPWEIFRGRLLERSQTREPKTFLTWNLIESNDAHPATEPLISIKLDVHERRIHVTRGLLVYAHEGYDAGGGVIETREAIRWTRELVGTMSLADFADLENMCDELICLIWQAVVGTSRLPLTSVEAPLPAFSFGKLHYLYESELAEQPCRSWEEWLVRGQRSTCAWRETLKLVEFTLRQIEPAQLPRLHEIYPAEPRLLRSLFNEVSLSPYTRFVDNALACADRWWDIDSWTFMLRQLCRHLSAYDLVTFHHRGANYPDALLLDAVLRCFVAMASHDKQSRRAFRHACLMRRHYEGHLVPDAPTSPGENARVMPPSHPRVDESQLTQSIRRRRKLFADAPLATLLDANALKLLEQSVRDLEHLDERVEMGLGLFIDRPLGYGKDIGEPDLTPMLAHEAFSPSLARQRWRELKKLCAELGIPCDSATLDPLFENGPWPQGLTHAELAECPRPTAALADVRKVADDFVILRTLPGGLRKLVELFDWQALGEVVKTPRLCVQVQGGVIALYDSQLRRRVELSVDASEGFASRAGIEWPRAGLRMAAVWEDAVRIACDVRIVRA